jgi:hypothetical protein
MATTTQHANIAHRLYLGDYVGEFADDYDMDAVHTDYIAAIQALLPEGVTLLSNGDVLVECDMHFNSDVDWSTVPHNEDGLVDWSELVDSVNIDAILERHDRTAR